MEIQFYSQTVHTKRGNHIAVLSVVFAGDDTPVFLKTFKMVMFKTQLSELVSYEIDPANLLPRHVEALYEAVQNENLRKMAIMEVIKAQHRRINELKTELYDHMSGRYDELDD